MSPTEQRDRECMQQAIDLALAAERAGNLPIGSIVVLDGEVVAVGASTIYQPHYNPAGHAEIEAIRNVPPDLWPQGKRMTIYTTLEPCMMCTGTILLHQFGRVVFGAIDPLGGGGCVLPHLPVYFKDDRPDWDGPIMPESCDPLFERARTVFLRKDAEIRSKKK